MTGRYRPKGPRRPSSRRKGSDEVPELSHEEVQRRIDLRGGGVPLAPAQVERPVRDLRRSGRRGRTVARDALLVLGLVAVGLVTIRLVLPDGPLIASATGGPSASAAAVGSIGAPSLGPIRTPSLQTLVPIGSSSGAPGTALPTDSAPTPEPEPTPTLRPGQTPKPTPVPTKKPPTPGPTSPNRATVIVKMVVVNNSGGSAGPADWAMIVSGEGGSAASVNNFPGSTTGTTVSIPSGKGYRVIDDASQAGYVGRVASPDCFRADGGGGLAAGTTVTCTITRNDRPRVLVTTHVINNDGGSAGAADVAVTVVGGNAAPSSFNGSESGVAVLVGFDFAYSVAQSNLSGYSKSSTGACSASLGVDAPMAECTFTFDDDSPPPPTDSPAPIAWLFPVGGAVRLRGRRWWTTLRRR